MNRSLSIRKVCVALVLGCCVALPARADILHGVGNIGDGGASNPSAFKFPGILQSTRGLNFGGPSLPYNVAAIGATAASILTPGNQISQLVAKVNSGDVTLALMSIGDNDIFPNGTAIANGSLQGAALAAFQNSVAANIEAGVDAVLNAGGHVVMGGISNIVDSPAAAAIAADPVMKARAESALAVIENQLRDFAASRGIPFVDFFGLEKAVYDSGSFVVGGVNINLHTSGPDPHNFFQDSLNAGIVIRAEVANLWLQAMNMAYHTNIQLLSDHEILNLAGIGNEFTGETFLTATNLAQFAFAPAPEPSSFALLAVGLVGFAGSRRLSRRRR